MLGRLDELAQDGTSRVGLGALYVADVLCDSSRRRHRRKDDVATFSPIITVGIWVLAHGTLGMSDASATRNPGDAVGFAGAIGYRRWIVFSSHPTHATRVPMAVYNRFEPFASIDSLPPSSPIDGASAISALMRAFRKNS